MGIDNSPKQLETAARLQREHGLDFPLLLGNAERVPYPDASFDFAISEYGAVLWADPVRLGPRGRAAPAARRPAPRAHEHMLAYLTTAADAGEDDPLEERLLSGPSSACTG